MGCEIEVELQDGKVLSLSSNNCSRGKLYAQAEVVCPKRVITSTVRAENGEMIPVKTDKPIRKDAMFDVMKKINALTCKTPVAIGDILIENICEGANLVVVGNF